MAVVYFEGLRRERAEEETPSGLPRSA